MTKAREIVFNERKNLVALIIKDLENGEVPFWQKGWHAPLPENLATNKPYRGLNLIILNLVTESKAYKDHRWVTFKQATTKGYKIKKGAKGARIEYWGWNIIKNLKNEKGENIEVKEELVNPIIKYYYVYNVEEVEGVSKKAEGLEFFKSNDLIEKIINNSEVPIIFCSSKRAYYDSLSDKINMPNREYFKSENLFYSTVLHEMAHSTGHKSRLNRKMGGEKFCKDYSIEELTAELTSMFLQQQLGIEISQNNELFNNHKAYLEMYIKLLKETPNILFKVIREAEKATEYILNMANKES